MSSQTILVTGASGQLGRLIIRDLLKTSPQSTIVGLVRTETAAAVLRDHGAEARIANYEDAVSLRTAMSGVDRVLLCRRASWADAFRSTATSSRPPNQPGSRFSPIPASSTQIPIQWLLRWNIARRSA